jgi:hypothetical protein
MQELGWSFPLTDPVKIFWSIQRGTRHAINILRIASAKGFKFKQVNLQHKYEHYQKLVWTMDQDFKDAMDADVALFAGVDSFKMFGTKIDAGFAYTDLGEDITYNVEQLVNFGPTEDD